MTKRPLQWAATVIIASFSFWGADPALAITYQTSRVNNGVVNARYGSAIAATTDLLAVGAPADNGSVASTGAVYPYRNVSGSWSALPKLAPTDLAGYDEFGASVSISGNFMFVGAPKDDDLGSNAGSVYIFKYNTSTNAWAPLGGQPKLFATGAMAGENFGTSVSVSGNYALVGAPSRSEGGTLVGAVYAYSFNGASWVQQKKFLGMSTYSSYGHSVSLSATGDAGLVGAPVDGGNGAFYSVRRSGSTWTQDVQRVVSPDYGTSDNFGWSVSLDGTRALIGAFNNDALSLGRVDSGAAYAFTFNGSSWVLESKLYPLDRDSYDKFGTSVALQGSTALIGAKGDDGIGSAYLFTRNGSTWTQTGKLQANDRFTGDGFGTAVAFSGTSALVGSIYSTAPSNRTGALYIYPNSTGGGTPAPTCVGDVNNDGMVNIDDLVIVITGWNQASSTGDVNGDHNVNIDDLVQVITEWGMCM